mmetsp:Transcript_6934/g.12766  ORF Transcript_6934/g.12766 Transcript_6934/m.12766 type:complete len:511 (-) Transcript_6934:6-1538(-)
MVKLSDIQATATPNGDYVFDATRFGLLGRGANAVVVRANHKDTAQAVAVKIVTKKCNMREAELLTQFVHPNIVQLIDLQQDDKHIYLITELCRGGELFDIIAEHGPLPPGLARHLILQLIEGIEWLHSQGVIHWDIKPENLLLTQDFDLKIADFGFAVLSDEMPDKPKGTVPYMAPEFVKYWIKKKREKQQQISGGETKSNTCENGEKDQKLDPKAADMWSVGVVVHCILAGNFPFQSATEMDKVFRMHQNGEWSPQIPEQDADVMTVLMSLLAIDPQKRATAKECLGSKWLQSGQSNKGKTGRQLLDSGPYFQPSRDVQEVTAVSGRDSTGSGGGGVKRSRENADSSRENADNVHHQPKKQKLGYFACKTDPLPTKANISESQSNLVKQGPKEVTEHLPVKRLGWILPGKKVEDSQIFLEQIGKACAEIGFDAELDTEDFFVVARDENEDEDMFLVTLFQQELPGKPPSLLLDVQRLMLNPMDFNNAYRQLRVALKELNQWDGLMIASQ